MITVIIPANNEAALIGDCLSAVLASDIAGLEIIVAANGCSDATADLARAFCDRAEARGWTLKVLEIPEGDKTNALNLAEQSAGFSARVYLDADVVVDARLIGLIAAALDRPEATYASGSIKIALPKSSVSRAYRRIYRRVPFMRSGVPGCGIFAVNAAGRALWGAFPAIISDDTFVRLQFRADQRILVDAAYEWPLVEGFYNLVKVRRRQDIGVAEVFSRYPELRKNDEKQPLSPGEILRMGFGDPIGFAVYGAVALWVRLTRNDAQKDWSRGR